jgi:hypothetical protein
MPEGCDFLLAWLSRVCYQSLEQKLQLRQSQQTRLAHASQTTIKEISRGERQQKEIS